MSDVKESRLVEHEELRDIHRRIDSLKEEQEQNHKELTGKLHSLEIAVARGGRFPAGAWVAAAAILVTMVSGFAGLYSKLEAADTTSEKALALIERHVEGSSGRWQSIEENAAFVHEWEKKLPLLEQAIKALEGRVVGVGPNGWHRADHDLYDRAVQQQFADLTRRVESLEKGKR